MNFAHPIWLAGLLLLPLLAAAELLGWRTRARRWRALVAARLESRLVRGGSRLRDVLALLLLLAGAGLLLGAMARPQGAAAARHETIRGRNVIIMVDVSRSMLTQDVRPSRLEHAKALAHELVDALPNDRIGVIAMAGRPFVLAPMTIDHAAVHETISQLDTDTIPLGGTDVSSAVAMAVAAFKESGQKNNGLIILSDGEDHAGGLKQAAEAARSAGVFIFAVGIGTSQGEFIPDPKQPGGLFRDRDGRQVLSRLEEANLRQLANDTGGSYLASAAGADIPAMVANATTGLNQYEIRSASRAVHLEFYQWLLLPGILMWIAAVVVATRWRRLAQPATARRATAATAAAIAMTSAAITTGQSRAAEPTAPTAAREQLASQATLARGERRAALKLAEGDAAYQLGDWPGAGEAFSEALLARDPQLQASSHYNLGTALFQQGWQMLTGEPRYPGAERGPAAFEEAIAKRFDEWNKNPATESAPSPTFELLRKVTLCWTDAISHFHSTLAITNHEAARANQAMARHYLQQLRDALDQQQQELDQQLTPEQQQQQQQQQEQPSPGKGEGQENQPQQQAGQPGESGQPQQQPHNGQQGDQQNQGADQPDEQNQQPGEGGEQQTPEGGNGQQQPNQREAQNPSDQLDRDFQPGESKADRARRLLSESSDLERNAVPSGRRDFRRPEKDW